MTIRLRIIIGIGITVAVLMGTIYAISKTIIERDYSKLEAQYVEREVHQALAAVSDELSNLKSVVIDWAPWDETYTFIRDHNRDYLTRNLPDVGIANLRLNLVLFLDTKGRVVYGTAFDLRAGKSVPLNKRVERELLVHRKLVRPREFTTPEAGVVRLATGPALVTAAHILTSDNRGPTRGAVIMGRYLDELELRRLSTTTRLDLNIVPVGDPSLPQDLRRTQDAFATPGTVVVRPVNPKLVAGYALINDIEGKPYLMVRTSSPRQIYVRGRASARVLIASLLLAGLLFGVLILVLMERLLLSPLARLSTTLDRLGAEGDLTVRLPVSGTDELAHVARAGNSMLDALERSQQQLAESEASYRAVVEDQTDLIYRCLPDGTLTFANQAFCRYLGMRQEEVIGRTFKPLIPADDHEIARRALAELGPDNPVATVEHRVIAPDGHVRWQQWTNRLLMGDGGQVLGFQAVGHDITQRKQAEEQLNYLAYHDGLTGLANRLLFRDRLAQSLALAQRGETRLAVGILDLDHFKEVNDALGHEVGDRLLQEVAKRLGEHMRASDTIARMGGDEFLLILPGTDTPQRADALVRRLLGAFADPFTIDEHEIYTTASMGICLAPGDGDSVDDLVKNADLAMYRAKAHGRNTYEFFSPEMAATVAKRRILEENLWKALDRQEIHIYYQPFVDLRSRKVIGVEALIRWQHPEWGLLLPAQFVVVAEENGFIKTLDEFVLRTACAQVQKWHRAGLPALRIAVNLSVRHFEQQGRLEELIEKVLRETGFDPDLLELEISEGAAPQYEERKVSILRHLADLGVHIVIDGFGTGYCSLNHIQRLPADGVKIDGLFIQGIPEDAAHTRVTEAIITMTHALGKTVAADAVETPTQLEFLARIGCDRAQGYLLGAPMRAQDISAATLAHAAEQLAGPDAARPTEPPVAAEQPHPVPPASS